MSTTKKQAGEGEPELTYEQARAQLSEVVAALESGGAPLAESVELWRRGEALADICQRWLDGAKAALDAAPST